MLHYFHYVLSPYAWRKYSIFCVSTYDITHPRLFLLFIALETTFIWLYACSHVFSIGSNSKQLMPIRIMPFHLLRPHENAVVLSYLALSCRRDRILHGALFCFINLVILFLLFASFCLLHWSGGHTNCNWDACISNSLSGVKAYIRIRTLAECARIGYTDPPPKMRLNALLTASFRFCPISRLGSGMLGGVV